MLEGEKRDLYAKISNCLIDDAYGLKKLLRDRGFDLTERDYDSLKDVLFWAMCTSAREI